MKRLLIFFLSVIALKTQGYSKSCYKKGDYDKAIIQITVNLNGIKASDSFRLAFYDCVSNDKPSIESSAAMDKGGKYTFILTKIKRPGYISLFNEFTGKGYPKYILLKYFSEPGDIIEIKLSKSPPVQESKTVINYPYYEPYYNYKDYDILFSGKQSLKYTCRYAIDKIVSTNGVAVGQVLDDSGEFINNEHCDIAKAISLKLLMKYKNHISQLSYNIMKADFISEFELERLYWFSYMAAFHSRNDSSAFFKNAAISYENKIVFSKFNFSDKAKQLSFNYNRLIATYYYYFKAKRFLSQSELYNNIKSAYYLLKNNYSGVLRDQLLVLYIKMCYSKLLDQEIIEDAVNAMQTNYCLSDLKNFNKVNSKDNLFYDFSLPDVTGKIVKLKDFEGKVVFIDFWYKGCGNCITYFKETLSKVEDEFKSNPNIVFISINVDENRNNWIEAVKSGYYTSPSIINLNTEGKGVRHSLISFYNITSYPMPILIDKDGKLFSNRSQELRAGGYRVLAETINRALLSKSYGVKE